MLSTESILKMLVPARAVMLRKPIGLVTPSFCINKRSVLSAGTQRLQREERRWFQTGSGLRDKREKTAKSKEALVSSECRAARIAAKRYLPDFDVQDRVIIVTGGGRGLGLTMAQALYQSGATGIPQLTDYRGKAVADPLLVHCLDRMARPYDEFVQVQEETPSELGGELHYHHIDVSETENLRSLVGEIADQHSRLDGLIAAAGIQQVTSAIDYEPADVKKMMDINYTAVFMTAQAVGRQMLKCKSKGSIVLVASMSAFNANKGLRTVVYNSSKAAVAQLARNLAMEWGPYNIRVNALCPGNILTPMVQKNFDDEPHLKPLWEEANMLGRISSPEEFRGVGIYLLSDASSFVTGSSVIVDGGYTAW